MEGLEDARVGVGDVGFRLVREREREGRTESYIFRGRDGLGGREDLEVVKKKKKGEGGGGNEGSIFKCTIDGGYGQGGG